jgi:hypothetical protein
MTQLIDVPRVREMVRAAVAARPEQHNPSDEFNGCLYTDPFNETVHCIIGQVFADAGLPVPDCNVHTGVLNLHEYWDQGSEVLAAFTPEAQTEMGQIQKTFDTGHRRWDKALAIEETRWANDEV